MRADQLVTKLRRHANEGHGASGDRDLMNQAADFIETHHVNAVNVAEAAADPAAEDDEEDTDAEDTDDGGEDEGAEAPDPAPVRKPRARKTAR